MELCRVVVHPVRERRHLQSVLIHRQTLGAPETPRAQGHVFVVGEILPVPEEPDELHVHHGPVVLRPGPEPDVRDRWVAGGVAVDVLEGEAEPRRLHQSAGVLVPVPKPVVDTCEEGQEDEGHLRPVQPHVSVVILVQGLRREVPGVAKEFHVGPDPVELGGRRVGGVLLRLGPVPVLLRSKEPAGGPDTVRGSVEEEQRLRRLVRRVGAVAV